jgi:uncharacterized Zn-binding protein involved in type VI secretion
MHVCPLVTVLVPHVGGPVLLPSAFNVLIGNLPAAGVGSMCVCVGPPDSIITGAWNVLIGNRPAARMSDMTVHGGSVVLGCFNVLIGMSGAASGGNVGANMAGAGGGNAFPGTVGPSCLTAGKDAASLLLGMGKALPEWTEDLPGWLSYAHDIVEGFGPEALKSMRALQTSKDLLGTGMGILKAGAGSAAGIGALVDVVSEGIHQLRTGEFDGYMLGGAGIAGGTKGLLGFAAGTAAAVGVAAAFVSAPAWVPAAAAVAVGIGVGVGLDYLDDKFEITEKIAAGLEATVDTAKNVASAVADGAVDLAVATADAVGDAAVAVADTVSNAAAAAAEGVGNAVSAAGDAVSNVFSSIGSWF